MSKLLEQINSDLKDAMRAKEEQKRSVLRMLISAIKDKEISLRKGEDIILSEEQVLESVVQEVKKRKDSITSYEDGDRQDLADKEKSEIEMLEKYLPEQLSDEELEKIVNEVVASIGEVSQADFGKVMGQVMPRVKGKADGNQISAIVKKVLTS